MKKFFKLGIAALLFALVFTALSGLRSAQADASDGSLEADLDGDGVDEIVEWTFDEEDGVISTLTINEASVYKATKTTPMEAYCFTVTVIDTYTTDDYKELMVNRDEEYYDLYFNEPDPSGKEPYEPFMKKVRIDAGFYNKMIVGTAYIGGKSEVYDWVEEKDLPEWLEGIWANIDGGNGAGQLYMLLGCNADGEGYLSLRRYDDRWQYLAVEERVYFFPTGSANGHESGDVRRVSDGAVLLSNCRWVEEYVWRADDILGLGPFTMEITIYDPF